MTTKDDGGSGDGDKKAMSEEVRRGGQTAAVPSSSGDHHPDNELTGTGGVIGPPSPAMLVASTSNSSSAGFTGAVAVGGHLNAEIPEKGELDGQSHGTRPFPATQPGAVAVAGSSGAARGGENDAVDGDTDGDDKLQNRAAKRREMRMHRRPTNEEEQQSGESTDGPSAERKHEFVGGTLEGEGTNPPAEGNKSATVAVIPTLGDVSYETMVHEMEQELNASCSIPPENDVLPTAIPALQAELVTPPVEAFRVSIDEDPLNGTMISPLELEYTRRKDEDGYKGWCRMMSHHRWIIIAILVVFIVSAVAIPLVVIGSNQPDIEGETTPTQSPTYPYICYTSTLEILQVQINEETIPDVFVICPDTVIEIGTFRDPATNDFHFVNGDYTLTAIRPNVVIQCGLDGRRENNCVIYGGFIQVLTQQQMPPTPDGDFVFFNSTTDNFTLRGLTFTGKPDNSGPFQGNSVTLSHPGKNIRFEDCSWSDISAQSGLIAVGKNFFQDIVGLPLEEKLVDVTFFKCVFEDIVYDNPLIVADDQNVTIEGSVFRNIQLSALVDRDCMSSENVNSNVEYEGGCAMLYYCGQNATCTLKDLCVFNFMYLGVSVVHASYGSQLEYENLFLDVTGPDICQLTVTTADAVISDCTDIFLSPSCPLPLP
jgi:hypothetical protein